MGTKGSSLPTLHNTFFPFFLLSRVFHPRVFRPDILPVFPQFISHTPFLAFPPSW